MKGRASAKLIKMLADLRGRRPMKIRAAIVNNRKAQIELVVRFWQDLPGPVLPNLCLGRPSKDRIEQAYVDKELGNEAVTYILASGAEGTGISITPSSTIGNPGCWQSCSPTNLRSRLAGAPNARGWSRRELARRLQPQSRSLYRCWTRPTRARASVSSNCTVMLARLYRRSSCQIAKAA